MKAFPRKIVTLALLALALPPARVLAITDAEAKDGRALVKRYADSVVSIEMVITMKVTVGDRAMPPRENRVDVNGTVISPTGLTVTSLSTIDPRGAMESMRASQSGGQKVEFGETEFKDVKLRLANGTEVPSVIVLKDPDLNLAFIAPLIDKTAPARVFPYVALENAATPQVLGNYFIVWRAPKNMQRVPLVRTTNIVGVVEKPRTMFLISEQVVGVAVFDPAGRVLGVATLNLDNGRPTGLVVLPSADVADLAKQAAAIKPEEKTEEAEKQPGAEKMPVAEKPAPAAKPEQAPAPAAKPGQIPSPATKPPGAP